MLPAVTVVTASDLVMLTFADTQVAVVTAVAVLSAVTVSPAAAEITTVLVCGKGRGVQLAVMVAVAVMLAKLVAAATG